MGQRNTSLKPPNPSPAHHKRPQLTTDLLRRPLLDLILHDYYYCDHLRDFIYKPGPSPRTIICPTTTTWANSDLPHPLLHEPPKHPPPPSHAWTLLLPTKRPHLPAPLPRIAMTDSRHIRARARRKNNINNSPLQRNQKHNQIR